jgi:transposase
MHGALSRRIDHKLLAVVDANGNPITLKLNEGQAHERRQSV